MGALTKVFVTGATSLEDKEGYSVKCASGLAELSGASILAIGVVRRGGAIGKTSDIAMPGEIAPVKYGGTVNAGDTLLINSSSTFEASTPSDGDIIGAKAIEGGVSGDVKDALIIPATRYEAG